MSGFLPASAVRTLRRLSRDGMVCTLTVRRPTVTVGVGGASTGTAWMPVTALSGLACSLVPLGVPAETPAADAVRAATRFDVRVSVDALPLTGAAADTFQPQDRLWIMHPIRGVPTPLVLNVLGDQPRGTPYEVARHVIAERVDAGGVA